MSEIPAEVRSSIHGALQSAFGDNLICNWIAAVTFYDDDGDACWGVYNREGQEVTASVGLSRTAFKVYDSQIELAVWGDGDDDGDG